MRAGVAPALLGAAVADGGDPEALVEASAAALVAGHGVADDLDERARRAARAAVPVRRALRRRYDALSPWWQRGSLAAVGTVLGLGVPFAVYSLLWVVLGVDVGPAAYFAVLVALLTMATSVVAEAVQALEPSRLPEPGDPACSATDPAVTGVWPVVTVVVAAYLPNEYGTVPATVDTLLAHDYPGELDVLVAANGTGPVAEEVLAWLRARAATDRRLRVVLCPSSRSKAENVNAALTAARAVGAGGLVGVLDADHRLGAGACARAARWVAGGYADVVQGHNVVRNGSWGWLQRMVAVEFEAVYAVAHPGRAGLHGFGVFGGSNGFWRADLLDRLRMRPWMLTEDIDVSLRAVLDGARIASDPRLVSRELAPETVDALWAQRTRWAQGWHQVSRRYLRRMLTSPVTTWRQRCGAAFLLGWREAYPWVALQMVPVIAYQLFVRDEQDIHWVLPFFVFTGLFTTAVGPLQALFAWRLSVPEVRRHGRWFLGFLLLWGAPYGEAKQVVNRCAHLREWLGDDGWTVTPRRGTQPREGGAETVAPAERAVLPRVVAADRDGVVRSRALARPRGGVRLPRPRRAPAEVPA